MKKLFLAIAITTFLFIGFGVSAKDNAPKELKCPSGAVYDIENLYKTILPSDFPEGLLHIPACTKTAIPLTPAFYFPYHYVAVMTYSGNTTDDFGWSVFRAIVKENNRRYLKYIAIIEYDAKKNLHTVLWVSKVAEKGLEEYIYGLVLKINKRAGVISDL